MSASRRTLAATLLLLVARPTLSDEEPRRDETPSFGEVIEVIGTRIKPNETAVGASRADAAELASRKATTGDATELLRGVPGVSVNGAGGISSLPAVHGMADDRLRVQVDGTDLVAACPNHMNSPLSYADPGRIESVTVFSGITPVSVGGDSIGGSIQVKSAPPQFATAFDPFVASALVGSFYRGDSNALGYTVGATAASEWLNVTFRQSDSRSDGLRAAASFKPVTPGREGGQAIAGDVVASSAYSGTVRRSLGLALQAPGHLLELEGSQQLVGFEGFPNQRMDMTHNDNRLFTSRYRGTLSWGELEARLSYQDTQHEMNMGPDRFSFGTGMPMDAEAKTWGATVKADVVMADGHRIRAGAELQLHTLYDFWPAVGGVMGPNAFWNVDGGQRRRFDAFAEWEARWTGAWLTVVGLRSDTVMTDAGPVQGYNDALPAWRTDAVAFNGSPRRVTDHNWDLAATARYTPGRTQTYEGGYARKTRSPNLYQRYAWSTNAMAALMNNLVGDGNGYVGLPTLRPEVAHGFSVTGDWHDATRRRWGLKLTAYYDHVEDYIDARRCDFGQCSAQNVTAAQGFVLLQYANQTARLYGVDLSTRLLLAQADAWGALTATLAASEVRGENVTTHDGLHDIMPLNATVGLSHKLGTWTTTAELTAVASKSRVAAVRNEIPTGAYQLVNLRTGYDWRHFRLDIGIENLLDTMYFNPLGGAYVGQGASMSTTGVRWGVAVPGPARSFNVALNYNLDR
jgi:iron complex outermembrane receptor protein